MKDTERERWIKEECVIVVGCSCMCPYIIYDDSGISYCEKNFYEKCCNDYEKYCNELDGDDEEE